VAETPPGLPVRRRCDLAGLWKKKPLRRAELLNVAGAGTAVWALAFSPDRKLLAALHEKGHVRVWDAVKQRR
jgi:hypothetical protein